MRVRLDALEFELGNPYIQNNDVHVTFEYEELKQNELEIFLMTYVGGDEKLLSYRYRLKLIYIVDMNGVEYHDKDEMICEAIHFITPSLSELIMVLDSVVKEERH